MASELPPEMPLAVWIYLTVIFTAIGGAIILLVAQAVVSLLDWIDERIQRWRRGE